ncbi:MAG: GGDEF domain-containing protein, partial [Halocynthiibacter sp.]
ATHFKGQIVAARAQNDLLLNLSFGIGVTEAVRDYGLTSGDFAPTDLTVEMMYLVEAKSAVMNELRALNNRLHGAKVMAEEQAFTDTLTGLNNRRAMDHLLALQIERGEHFGLMHLDLDFFKDVNDTFGHAAGDYVLQHVAKILVTETRSDDTVIRAGGDEFVIILPKLTSHEKLYDAATRIIEKLEHPTEFNGKPCRISASVGITISDFYAQAQAKKMLADADIALYTSKNGGRSRTTIFSESLMAGALLS